MEIIDFIPVGHENAVSRQSLRIMTGLTDRHIRHDIHEARRTNVILNLQNGNGYFQPDIEDPIDRMMLNEFVDQETNRLRSIGWALKAARKLQRKCARKQA